MNAIIIDDENHARESLKLMLQNAGDYINIVAEASSASQAIGLIEIHKPDVIFLDIEMPLGSGFELLQFFPDPRFNVVFVTAYDHYALNAIKFSALDYILKPISIIDLNRAIKRINECLITKKNNEDLVNFLNNYNNPSKNLHKISIVSLKGYELVEISTILYIESEARYSKFFLTTGKIIISTKNIGDYEELLSEYDFFRPHASYCVNKMHVLKLDRGIDPFIKITNEHVVPVSRRRKQATIKWLSNNKPSPQI